MSDRYVTRADHMLRDPFDGTEVLMGTVVFDNDRETPTGLLSAAGLMLYRVRETVTMGFQGKVKE